MGFNATDKDVPALKRLPKSPLALEDTMGVLDVATALEAMKFTAAHDWRRTVSMDRNTRDMIVRSIRRLRSSSGQ